MELTSVEQERQEQDRSAVELRSATLPRVERYQDREPQLSLSDRPLELTVPGIDIERDGNTETIKNLDRVDIGTQVAAENILTRKLNSTSDMAYLYAGRNRFRLVPREAAEAFQLERLMDLELSQRERSTTPRISEQTIVFSGGATHRLGQRILDQLGVTPGNILQDSFPNSETRVEIHESVRDRQAVVIADIGEPVNESLIESALTVQALKLAGARKISVVLPYFCYSRQDRKADTRPPISAKAVTDLFKVMGAHQIVTVDLHARQVEGFFDGPFDNLEGGLQMVRPLVEQEGSELVVVSPDAGGGKRAESFSRAIEQESGSFTPMVVMSKFRDAPGKAPRVTMSVGSETLQGKTCVLVDDMIDTGGSMIAAATALKEHGAKRVVVCATHGVFSQDAIARLEEARMTGTGGERAVIDRIYVSDTVPINHARNEFLQVVSLAPLLAEVITRLDRSDCSIGELNERRDLGSRLRSYGVKEDI